jgi:DNA-binding NtrC family response regulator
MQKLHILLVDDEKTSRFSTKHILGNRYKIDEAETREECFEKLKKQNINLVILDLMMPDVAGFELLEKIKSLYPNCNVIILTSEYDIEKAVQAIQKGADDYIVKEAAKKTLPHRIEQILSSTVSKQNLEGLRSETQLNESDFFIPDHPRYQACYQLALKAASKNLRLLIQGETGVGKDILVRYIRHHICPNAPIISLNCGAIPESLAEAELFGTTAHAFTDAKEQKGKLELADGGILFLDEVGNMPLSIQKKLLRVLETQTVSRIGSHIEIPTHFLVISATNANLEADIQAGHFREDLYFRLKDVIIELPSLREVPEAIPQFIDYFLQKFNAHYGESFKATPEFYAHLNTNLSGNIRALKKEIQTIVALGEIPNPPQIMRSQETFSNQVHHFEMTLIQKALQDHKNNISQAAEALGLKRTTLIEKIKKLSKECN